MSAPDPKPPLVEESALTEDTVMCECGHAASYHGAEDEGRICYGVNEGHLYCDCEKNKTEVFLSIIASSRSDLAAAQKRAEAAEAKRDELANWIKRIHGQAEAAQAVIHGKKLEADLEVTLPTAK